MKKTVLAILTIGAAVMFCAACGNKDTGNDAMLERGSYTKDESYDTVSEQARVVAEITAIDGNNILVKPEDGAWELNSSDVFSLPEDLLSDDIEPKEGMWLEIIYSGSIQETYPAAFGGITSISEARDPVTHKATEDLDVINELAYDDLGIAFMKNQLIIMSDYDTDDKEVEALIDEIGAKTVDYIDGVKTWLIQLEGDWTYEELEELIEQLDQNPIVTYVDLNYVGGEIEEDQ